MVYDLTVRFGHRFIDKRSRTHDQMVQVARSGVQNIAEGSQARMNLKEVDENKEAKTGGLGSQNAMESTGGYPARKAA